MKLSTQNRNEEKKSKRTPREEGCKLSLNLYCPSGFSRVSHSASCFNLLGGGSNRLEGEMRFPFHFRLLSGVCVKLFPHIPFLKVRNSFWEPTLSPYLMMQNGGRGWTLKSTAGVGQASALGSRLLGEESSPFCLWSWVLSPLLLVLYFSTVSLNTVVGWQSGFECY